MVDTVVYGGGGALLRRRQEEAAKAEEAARNARIAAARRRNEQQPEFITTRPASSNRQFLSEEERTLARQEYRRKNVTEITDFIKNSGGKIDIISDRNTKVFEDGYLNNVYRIFSRRFNDQDSAFNRAVLNGEEFAAKWSSDPDHVYDDILDKLQKDKVSINYAGKTISYEDLGKYKTEQLQVTLDAQALAHAQTIADNLTKQIDADHNGEIKITAGQLSYTTMPEPFTYWAKNLRHGQPNMSQPVVDAHYQLIDGAMKAADNHLKGGFFFGAVSNKEYSAQIAANLSQKLSYREAETYKSQLNGVDASDQTHDKIRNLGAGNTRADVLDVISDIQADTAKGIKNSPSVSITKVSASPVTQTSLPISSNTSLKAQDENGWTKLNLAAYDNDKSTVSTILSTKEGRDTLSITNSHNFTPLNTAVLKGNKEIIDSILATEEGRAILATPDNVGYTPLNGAALNGQTEIAKSILALPEGRATLGITGTHNYTPLNSAALHGNSEIVNAILATDEGKATIAVQDTEGHTPINTAALNNHKEAVDLILATPEGRGTISTPETRGFTPLNNAASNGNKDIVEAILKTDEGKATLNMHSNNKLMTPLISAIYCGKSEVADILSKTEGVKITDEDIAVNKAYIQSHPSAETGKDDAFIKALESKKVELDKGTASLAPKDTTIAAALPSKTPNEADIKSAFAEIQKATKDLTDGNVNGNNDPAAIKQFLAAASKLSGKEIKLADGVELSDKTFLDSGFSNNVAQLQAKIGSQGKVTKEEIDKTVAIAEEMAANKGGIIKASGDTHLAKSDAVDPKLLAYDTSKLQVAL